jgi:hypothetical protein
LLEDSIGDLLKRIVLLESKCPTIKEGDEQDVDEHGSCDKIS